MKSLKKNAIELLVKQFEQGDESRNGLIQAIDNIYKESAPLEPNESVPGASNKDYARAYFQLLALIQPVKDARLREIAAISLGVVPTWKDWADYTLRLAENYPAVSGPLNNLLRSVGHVQDELNA